MKVSPASTWQAPIRPTLLAWVREVLRDWHWRHSLAAFAIGAATLFSMGLPLQPSPEERAVLVPLIYNVLQFGFPLVLAVRVADRAVATGIGRLVAYGSAVALVGVVGVWVIARLLWPLLGRDESWGVAQDIWLAVNTQLFHALGVAVYAQWRREQQARERLMTAQAAQGERLRQLAAARLLALQAQVEPALLFDALRRVEQQVDAGDAAAADTLLADLITLLRLLLPRSDALASTLAREIALIRAFTRVAGVPALAEPRLLWVVGEGTNDARLAPMWLLTLLRAQAAAADAADPGASWVVSAQLAPAARRARPVEGLGAEPLGRPAPRDGPRLRIVIVATRGDALAQQAAARQADRAGLEAQLRSVHGDSATMTIGAEPHVLWVIELPFVAELPSADDHAPSPDR